MKTRRYWVFAYNNIPDGGMNDFLIAVDTPKQGFEQIGESKYYYGHVVDSHTADIIREE